MNKLTSILLFLLPSLIAISSKAQSLVTFSSDEGLSNTCVRSIFQDSYKNVWITTRNGLNRWDGVKINVYHKKNGDPYSLLNDMVTCVNEYRPGKIVIGTDTGLSIYDYATNSFTKIPIITSAGDTISSRVISITKVRGKLHICSFALESFFIEETENGFVTKATDEFTRNNVRTHQVLEAHDGKVWFINRDGNVFYTKNKKYHKVNNSETFTNICLGSNDAVYAFKAMAGKLFKYNPLNDRFDAVDLGPSAKDIVVKTMRSDGEGNIMICTDGSGVFVYNEKTGRVSRTALRTADIDLMTSNIEDVMVDVDGNMWIGIYWKGVVVKQKNESTFSYVGHRNPDYNNLGSSCITAISAADKGMLWVGADHNGLFYMQGDGSKSKHYSPNEYPGVPLTITAIKQDHNGKVWLGSSVGGLVCFNPATTTFTPFTSIVSNSDNVSEVYGIDEDMNHNLWFATMGRGIFRYNMDDGSLAQFTSSTINTPTNDWVSCIRVIGENLLVGASNSMDIISILPDNSLKNLSTPIRDCTVRDIKESPDGTIWVATNQGLYNVDMNGKVLAHFTDADGLCDNVLSALQINCWGTSKQKQYDVWVSSDNGLCCYSASLGSFRSFYYSDGLQGNEFKEGASEYSDNKMYFGGINGLTFFNPSDALRKEEERSFSLRIVDFYLFGEPVHVGSKSGSYEVLSKWISEADEVNLCHSDNTFSFELSTMSVMPQNVVYEYSVNNNEWVSIGVGQNRVVFTNLSPGTYDIRIRANTGTSVSEERTIRVIIHRPWYLSIWAYIIYLLLICSIGYFAYRMLKDQAHARRVLRQHRQEEEMNEARMQFFMNISHEIRTPMTLILAPLEELLREDKDEKRQRSYNLIHRNSKRILRLINQMMDVRKIEKGEYELQKSNVEVVSFIQSLYELFSTTASGRNIDFSYNHSNNRIEAYLESSSLDKIVMNLLSNAFKFTPDGGKISLDLQESANDITIMVTDSGVGVPDDRKDEIFRRFYSGKHPNGYIGTGIGLNLTHLLVELHGGNIHVEDNPNESGSRFIVTLPKDNYNVGIHAEEEVGDEENANVTNVAATTISMTDDHETDTPNSQLPIEAKKGLRHRNVLVVEDDADIRQYIHSELSADFVIHECGNGKEGWDYLIKNHEKVDLIISDVMMPVMEGTTLCKYIKTNFNTSHLPVILLTAKSTDADRIAAASIGADAYITKPFNMEVLRSTALQLIKTRIALLSGQRAEVKAKETIEKVTITSPDEQLLDRIHKSINKHMDDSEFSIEQLADEVGVSRVHFYRKVKEITGVTPREYIKSIRLKQAAELLRGRKTMDITSVSVATGFSSPSVFSSSFKAAYGMSPSEYMKANS